MPIDHASGGMHPGRSGKVGAVGGSDDSSPVETSTRLTLEATGITLMGVILSIGLTVALGLRSDLWVTLLAGAGSAGGLLVLVKLSSSEGAALRRAANWITRAGPQR